MAAKAIITKVPNRKGWYLGLEDGAVIQILARFMNKEAADEFQERFLFVPEPLSPMQPAVPDVVATP